MKDNYFSAPEMVVANRIKSVEGIAVDWVSKNIYFTDNVYGFIGVVRITNHFRDRREIITGMVYELCVFTL